MNRPGQDVDIRSLRYFVAVAEELHFTRAAGRLFIAQQALSREIGRLERDLGVALFTRTTRRVNLTLAGERLLDRAREIVALHDRTIREMRQTRRPVVVDLSTAGRRTGRKVLERARAGHPALEFRGRHGGGLGSALAELAAGELDAAFGRLGGLGRLPAGVQHTLIRYEPLAVLLPAGHPLAAAEHVESSHLRGLEVDAGVGNPKAPEWSDLAEQLLLALGARSTAPHVPAEGLEEQAHHLVRQGLPILTGLDHVRVPGGQLRGIVGPVPVQPWSVVYRPEVAGVEALLEAARELADVEGWLDLPDDAWLPEPERTRRGGDGRDRQPDAGQT